MNIINWRLSGHILGLLVLLETAFLAVATSVALYYNLTGSDQDFVPLLMTSIISLVIGTCLLRVSHGYHPHFSHREGFLITSNLQQSADVHCLLQQLNFFQVKFRKLRLSY